MGKGSLGGAVAQSCIYHSNHSDRKKEGEKLEIMNNSHFCFDLHRGQDGGTGNCSPHPPTDTLI